MLDQIINLNLDDDETQFLLVNREEFWTYINALLNDAKRLTNRKQHPEINIVPVVFALDQVYNLLKSLIERNNIDSKLKRRFKRKIARINRYFPILVTYMPIRQEFEVPSDIRSITSQNTDVVAIYKEMGKEVSATDNLFSSPVSEEEMKEWEGRYKARLKMLAKHPLPLRESYKITTRNPLVAQIYKEMGKTVVHQRE